MILLQKLKSSLKIQNGGSTKLLAQKQSDLAAILFLQKQRKMAGNTDQVENSLTGVISYS